jgi:3',5'-cyclic AMP phosphodiesterase CpdA
MHAFHLSLNPLQFFSKCWVGNLNGLINRQLHYHADPNPTLIDLFLAEGINMLLFSGDLTTTSIPSEFETVKRFIEQVREAGIEVLVVPGNHDKYTREAEATKRFYDYFPCEAIEPAPSPLSYDLREDGVVARRLCEGWWYVGMDTTIATKLFSAKGRFSKVTQHNLEQLLEHIPEGDRVVMMSHYPLFASPHPSHNLERADALRNLLRHHHNVKLYLHGHVHRLSVTDRRKNGLPIILNSGSCGSKRRASCLIVDVDPDGCTVRSFRSRGNAEKGVGGWVQRKNKRFEW